MWDQNAITIPKTLKGKRKIEEKTKKSSSSGTKDDTKTLWQLTKNNREDRTEFEVTKKRKDDLSTKFKFLPETIDERNNRKS